MRAHMFVFVNFKLAKSFCLFLFSGIIFLVINMRGIKSLTFSTKFLNLFYWKIKCLFDKQIRFVLCFFSSVFKIKVCLTFSFCYSFKFKNTFKIKKRWELKKMALKNSFKIILKIKANDLGGAYGGLKDLILKLFLPILPFLYNYFHYWYLKDNFVILNQIHLLTFFFLSLSFYLNSINKNDF